MEQIIIALFAIGIILFIISFFLRDPYKDLRNEFDQFTMQQIQEIYQIKKKLKLFEEELLMDEPILPESNGVSFAPERKKEINPILKNQVWSLYLQGLTVEQICKQSSLSRGEVEQVIHEFSAGDRYE